MSAESFSNYLQRVKRVVAIKADSIQQAALISLESEHKTRIFNDGRATDGKSIGKYSAKYGRYRVSKGKQAAYVDLEFYSNLRNSIEVGRSEGKNVYGFINDLQRKIAQQNQVRFKKKIFNVTPKEAKDTLARVKLKLREAIRNV